MRFYQGISSTLMSDEGLRTILTACLLGKRQNEENLSFWNKENIASIISRHSSETERGVYNTFKILPKDAGRIYLFALTMEMNDTCPDVW